MSEVDWVIWYERAEDGEIFSVASDEVESIYDVPRVGCQIVVFKHPDVGRRMIHRGDYFWWHPRYYWKCGDLSGLIDHLCFHNFRDNLVLLGRELSDAKFKEAYLKAKNDPRLPQKEGRAFYEREVDPFREE